MLSYNRRYIIERAINSLLSQSEQDWELIVVDDGSSDNTFQLINSYIKKYPRIRYMHHENRGVGLSRNAGIEASCGMYITFLDSDDEYKPNHLEVRKRLILQHPGVDLIHGGIEILGDPFVPDAANTGCLIHLDNCVTGGTFIFKKELAKSVGGFVNVEIGDDLEFFRNVEKAGYVTGKTSEPTYIYHRDSDDSICNRLMNEL